MTDVLMIVIIGGFFLAAALLVQAPGRVVADASEDWDSGGPAEPGVSDPGGPAGPGVSESGGPGVSEPAPAGRTTTTPGPA
jgi:hypothetical protein